MSFNSGAEKKAMEKMTSEVGSCSEEHDSTLPKGCERLWKSEDNFADSTS